jgi:tetratricopeptide (TPR) repeat protein
MKALASIIIVIMLSGCGMNRQANLPYDMTIANKGYEAMIRQDYDEAEAFFDLALSVNPVNPYALLNLGVVYQNTGRIEKAKNMYLKVIELNSEIKATHTTDITYQGKTLADIAETNLRTIKQ